MFDSNIIEIKYDELETGDVIFGVQCSNFAGFFRKRLPELNEKIDVVRIKRWEVGNNIYSNFLYLCEDFKATGDRDVSHRIDKTDFDTIDQGYYHRDENSAIAAAKRFWNQDNMYRKKGLIIITTCNEEIFHTI